MKLCDVNFSSFTQAPIVSIFDVQFNCATPKLVRDISGLNGKISSQLISIFHEKKNCKTRKTSEETWDVHIQFYYCNIGCRPRWLYDSGA